MKAEQTVQNLAPAYALLPLPGDFAEPGSVMLPGPTGRHVPLRSCARVNHLIRLIRAATIVVSQRAFRMDLAVDGSNERQNPRRPFLFVAAEVLVVLPDHVIRAHRVVLVVEEFTSGVRVYLSSLASQVQVLAARRPMQLRRANLFRRRIRLGILDLPGPCAPQSPGPARRLRHLPPLMVCSIKDRIVASEPP